MLPFIGLEGERGRRSMRWRSRWHYKIWRNDHINTVVFGRNGGGGVKGFKCTRMGLKTGKKTLAFKARCLAMKAVREGEQYRKKKTRLVGPT